MGGAENNELPSRRTLKKQEATKRLPRARVLRAPSQTNPADGARGSA